MYYKMRAMLTIDSRQTDTKRNRESLQKELYRVLSFFQPYAILTDDKNAQFHFYYPDEEAEMRAAPSIALSVEFHRECASFREVVLLAQIVQTTATWLDAPCGYSYRCQILAPYLVAKNGDIYTLP